VEERPAAASDIPGESSWPTQPNPLKPPALVPQCLTENDLWKDDPRHHTKCWKRFRTLRNNGTFTPQHPIDDAYPATTGGVNRSGGAFDRKTGVLYVPGVDEKSRCGRISVEAGTDRDFGNLVYLDRDRLERRTALHARSIDVQRIIFLVPISIITFVKEST
jgi:quinoprotein glucose dehydrogenase